MVKKSKFDSEEGYCRRLGHHVPFSYCVTEKQEKKLPCSLILDCWFEKIPIEEYIRKNYTKEEISRIFAASPPKITSLLDLVNKARNKD